MALTYDLTKIADYEKVCVLDDGSMSGVTHALIFATIGTGIGEITEKDAAEFYARLHIIERVHGSLTRGGDSKDRFITVHEVKAHIGLKTNVFPKETRAKWLKRFFSDNVMRDLVYDYNRAATKAEKEEVAS